MSSQTLPQPQGPEYTPCQCGHIEPEHEPNAGECYSCDCEAYQPTTAVLTPDRANLRERIAEAVTRLHETGGVYALDAGEPERIADAVLAVLSSAAPTPPTDKAAVLSDAERTMLTYALDQAQERIWSEDGFTDEDQAAVDSLRRVAAEAQQQETDSVTPPPALTEVGRLRSQIHVLTQEAERDRGLAKVGARCMRVGHQGLIEQGRVVLEGWRFALSTALDLGTGALWEAIHERAKELSRAGGEDGAETQQQDQPEPAPPAPRCALCTHPKPDHDGRADHRAKHSLLVAGEPWCHACNAECDYTGAQQQDPAVHGCTIDGQPAMPILVAEYNHLVTRAAEAEAQQQETTESKAAALDLTSTEYRAQSHRAAVDAIRSALPGLYASVALRVEDALAEARQLPDTGMRHACAEFEREV